MLRATLLGHPLKEHRRIQINAVTMQAAVGAAGGQVAALGVAIGMLGAVGADDTGPTLLVGARQQQAVVGQPHHHVVCAVVADADWPMAVFGFARRYVEGGANLLKGEVTLGMKLHKRRRKFIAARF